MGDDKGLHVSDDSSDDKETRSFSRQPTSHWFDKMEVGVLEEFFSHNRVPFRAPPTTLQKTKNSKMKKEKKKQEDSAQNKQVHHPLEIKVTHIYILWSNLL